MQPFHISESEDQLEDDDLELIAENMGIDYHPKRSRHARFEDDDEDEDNDVGATEGMHTARDSELFKQQEDLFGPSDEEFEEEEEIDEEDVRPRKAQQRQPMPTERELESDEEDDFIVDDHGQPIRRQKHMDDFSDSLVTGLVVLYTILSCLLLLVLLLFCINMKLLLHLSSCC
jgi:hypothetical protein